MGSFIYYIVDGVLGLLVMAIIISAVLSWLVAFNVINTRHPFIHGVVRVLDAVTLEVVAQAVSELLL